MILSYYEFYNPSKLISGQKAVDQLTFELDCEHAARPIIITDEICTGKGIVKRIINALGGAGIIIGGIYDKAAAGSTSDIMNEIAGVYRDNRCDAVIAAGGSAVFDVAGKIRGEILSVEGLKEGVAHAVPYFAIPTAGDGAFSAGASGHAAVTGAKGHFPDIIVLDPEMMIPSGRGEIAETGIEALAISIETALCENISPVNEAFAFAAIRKISENLFKAVKKYKNRENVFSIANASVQAGFASSNDNGGIIPALTSSLLNLCGIPRGIASGILLPRFMEYKNKTSKDALAKLLLPLAGNEDFADAPSEKRAGDSISIVRDILSSVYDKCRMPKTLSEAGVEKAKLNQVAGMSLADRKRGPNYGSAGRDDLMEILEKAY